MTTFRYKGQTAGGAKVSGVLRAYDEFEAADKLRESVAIITKLEAVPEKKESVLSRPVAFRVKEKELALLCSQFAIILASGLSVERCVSMVAAQTKNKYLRRMLDKVSEEVGAGYSLAQSFENNAPYLPKTFTETLRAGEQSGTLESCFQRLHAYYDRSAKTRAKIVSTLTYPVMVIIVAIVVFVIIIAVAVPAFTDAFTDLGSGSLPGVTRALMAVSAFFTKWWWLVLGVLALLTGIVVFIFREHWAEISEALSRLTLGQGLLALAVGLSYPLLEGVSSWLIVRSRLPHFPLRQGIDNAWMGTFGNVVGLGAGSVPFQTWYLHRRGLDVGPGVGLMTLQYVFHKTAVLLYATVLLLAGRPWIAAHSDGVLRYLPGAYAVVAGVIVGLIALCALPVVQRLARWLLHFLPDTGRWAERRESWLEQLDTLSTESRHLLADKPRCAAILGVHLVKLFLLFCLPWMGLRFMELDTGLTFWQVQLLTSLTLFVSNALPNVAGMGSVETAFLLVYSSFLPDASSMSLLMFYRLASYYAVFAASAVGFALAQRRLSRE